MNEQEQRIAIAEFYGFRIVSNQDGHDYAIVKPDESMRRIRSNKTEAGSAFGSWDKVAADGFAEEGRLAAKRAGFVANETIFQLSQYPSQKAV